MTQQAVDKVLQQIANLQKVVNPSEAATSKPRLRVSASRIEDVTSRATDLDQLLALGWWP